eukprot:gnl/Spiro4/25526_TR12726_c0_g1_i1.p1 gnl/Spiro4/25526_TR12726_c0_g1~~gnl/Spiro4/25526_TR12726_c0_g1_i1.p1  ORF type:complete len:698 (+),score=126.70 gnl/Spiro4/25526_TR12726_c0_g1_i1:88-2094(+)
MDGSEVIRTSATATAACRTSCSSGSGLAAVPTTVVASAQSTTVTTTTVTAVADPPFSLHHEQSLDWADGLLTLPREVEEGNVEYKRKLVNPTPLRLEHLITQMKWRLGEGHGECIYEIGVDDDGSPCGLSDEDLAASLATVRTMCASLSADMCVVQERPGRQGKIVELLIRQHSKGALIDIRVAVIGNVDAGKSTMIGVLTTGRLDNGRGLVRAAVMNHKHEIETGRTSSISQQIIGFDSNGLSVNDRHCNLRLLTWPEIVQESTKLVTFIDLAGHEKYISTTIHGLSSHTPDYSCIMIGSNAGVTKMTQEHMIVAVGLKVPMYIVVTKVDMCPPNILEETMALISTKLRQMRKTGFVVRSREHAVTASKQIPNDTVVPIFLVSNVTGVGFDNLKLFLNLLPVRELWASGHQLPAQFQIEANYVVAGIGTIVSGVCQGGTIRANQVLLLGPDNNGNFQRTVIKSIQYKRTNVLQITAGQSASLALKKVKRKEITKGMMLLDPSMNPQALWEFDAEVLVLFHSTTVKVNYQPFVHCGVVRQCCKIVRIHEGDILRSGERAMVTFRFVYHPAYVVEGTRLIFRDGRAKGIGKVVRANPKFASPENARGLPPAENGRGPPPAENGRGPPPAENERGPPPAENGKAPAASENGRGPPENGRGGPPGDGRGVS